MFNKEQKALLSNLEKTTNFYVTSKEDDKTVYLESKDGMLFKIPEQIKMNDETFILKTGDTLDIDPDGTIKDYNKKSKVKEGTKAKSSPTRERYSD